jgi:hypothetical protein
MGLISFSIAMIAALILYLRPADTPFSLADMDKVLAPLGFLRARFAKPGIVYK